MTELEAKDDFDLQTETEAWELLRKVIAGEIKVDAVPKLTLGPWAKIDVYIPAERYDAAMTPYMMKGWVDLQRSVYRAYALVHGGAGAANTLSDREKERLELVVEVRSGSSDQTVDIQAIIESVAASLVGKMEPEHILIAVLTLILTWGGSSAFSAWMERKKEEKLAEIELLKTKETQKSHLAALEAITTVATVDRARTKLLAQAAQELPVVASLQEEADRGREALVKHVTKSDAVVNGIKVSADTGQAITSRTRVTSIEVRLDGLYKIRKVDTTVETGFRVHLSDRDGNELVGDVAEVMTTLEDRQVIQEAEWSKVPVFLQINAKKRRDEVVDAIIVRARTYDPATDGAWR